MITSTTLGDHEADKSARKEDSIDRSKGLDYRSHGSDVGIHGKRTFGLYRSALKSSVI